jgi:cytochrome P450
MAFDVTAFNPHDPAFLADPYPVYAQFRNEAPVAKVAPYGSYWVFRHEDVKTVLTATDLFLKSPPAQNAQAPVKTVLSTLPPGVFSMDPPRHNVVRPILDGLFASAITQAPALASQKAGLLIANARVSRRIELVADFATPLPASVLLSVLGIPGADGQAVSTWVGGALAGHDITASASAKGMAGTCALALGAYFQALMRLCPAHAELTGMVPSMARAGLGAGMSFEEAQQSAVNLVIAGYLSTTFLICSGVLNLIKTPGTWQALREAPQTIPVAIEEMMRFDAPAQLVDRYAAADTELAGVALKAGDAVTAVLGSANRDSAAFPNADTFDIERSPNEHVAFGSGIHYCLGAPLARLVAPVAIEALLEAFPSLTLAGLPQWQTDPYLRALASLPLAIG